jgi:hypothetical protein
MTAMIPSRPTQSNEAAEWDTGKRRGQDVPDVRWTKILAIRSALEHGTYDVEARLERTVRSIQADLAASSD